ncbi:MAG: hypothetical protein H7177_13505 [Rhizobacter sp.]|nr:hypothetical protein [Bacteriovorax sp.]
MKNVKYIIMSALFILAPALKAEMKLSPFETDGCTMFIDGPPGQPELWRHCCVEHDLRYWFGGSVEDMDKTDLRLKECVQKDAGVTWATLVYNGVRAGHHSPIKNKTQWGWAWIPKREKAPLTSIETAFVLASLKNINEPSVNMEEFLKFYFPTISN